MEERGRHYRFLLVLLVIGLFAGGGLPAASAAPGASPALAVAPDYRQARSLPAVYSGPTAAVQALEEGAAQPLTLAAADFDADGLPDLAVGYGREGGGIVTLQLGNLAALWPDDFSGAGSAPASPFLPATRVFELDAPPHFLAAGDFDNDGHQDLVAAARGEASLHFLPGDGQAGFAAERQISLDGGVTALVAGDVNRRDGLADLVVGVSTPGAEGGGSLLVFEGLDGALRSEPEATALPATVQALALGQLDEHYAIDLAVAAGSDLFLVHGRDRQASDLPATIDRHPQPGPIAGLAVGDFAPDPEGEYRLEIALLSDEGHLRLLPAGGTAEGAPLEGGDPALEILAMPGTDAALCALPAGGLALTDPGRRQLHLLSPSRQGMTTPVGDTPDLPGAPRVSEATLALLPMRLNPDAQPDFVLLEEGATRPLVLLSTPANTFVVDSETDTADADLGDGVCADNAGRCTLRAAIMQANASFGSAAIVFELGTGTPSIGLLSALPDVLAPVSFLGNTGGATRIEVKGSGDGTMNGLTLQAAGCTVRRLVLNGFGAAIYAPLGGGGGHYIEGNYLGTDASGSGPAANNAGVHLQTASNTIGGTMTPARNVISGNKYGVVLWIPTATGNLVQGNYIGTDVGGTLDVGNTSAGVDIDEAPNNTVGGTAPGARNLISGNDDKGVRIAVEEAQGNLVQGNLIGTDLHGTADVGNYIGVIVAYASDNTIGGTALGAGNVIAHSYSNYAGLLIEVGSGTGNRINRNVFWDSTQKAIEVATVTYGEDEQDPGDADEGPNRGQNWPVLSEATVRGGHMEVTFQVDSAPASADYPLRVEFFLADGTDYGAEGTTYLGSAQYLASEAQTAVQKSFPLESIPAEGSYVIATATDAAGNSSEFSFPPLLTGVAPPITVNSSLDLPDANPGDGVCAATGGACTLRAAMETSDKREGGATVNFNIPGGGVPKIQPQSPLPRVTRPIVLDGSTQPGGKVELDGTLAGQGADGLRLAGGYSTVRGLVINRFDRHGILVEGGAGSRIEGCILGSDATGTLKLGNHGHGIAIHDSASNTIGGTEAAMGNTIVANHQLGIEIQGVAATGNRVLGNWIGTNAASGLELGNGDGGVDVEEASGNIIGQAGAGNVIASNGGTGISIAGSSEVGGARATANRAQGNYIGTDAADRGCAVVPNLGNGNAGISLTSADGNLVGGWTAAERNVIGCNGFVGILLFYANANVVRLNRIGIDSTGTGDLGNDGGGMNIVGRDNQVEANLISGNHKHGIRLSWAETQGNVVQDNLIGTDATGSERVSNRGDGVWLDNAPDNRVIGNLISGQGRHGVHISGSHAAGNQVTGNRIGTDLAGSAALDNNKDGVHIAGAPRNTIGGLRASWRNVISGNNENGITIDGAGAVENVVQGNYIGTNTAGDAKVGNKAHGVLITASGNRVERNLVSGNDGNGLRLDAEAAHNRLLQNQIGTSAGGAGQLSNAVGVYLGFDTGVNYLYNNVIRFNCRGLEMWSSAKSILRGNTITDNTCSTGIYCRGCGGQIVGNNIAADQGGDGILCQDGGDPLVSGNNLQDNAGYGLRNLDGSLTVRAEDNWWGAADGPGGAGPGSGDEVSDDVDFDPWRSSAVALVAMAERDPLYAARGTGMANVVHVQNLLDPDDTVDVTVGDTQGWLVSPASLALPLDGGLGASLAISLSVPAGAPLGTVDEVTVQAVSQANPSATATATFQVIASLVADLSLEKHSLLTFLPLDRPAGYLLRVANAGPDAAATVAVTDTLPAGLAFVSATPSQGTCAAQGQDVVCDLGSLPAGGGATVEVYALVSAAGVYTNTARVASTIYDPALYDNEWALAARAAWGLYLPVVLR